jgi:hypothetical protein
MNVFERLWRVTSWIVLVVGFLGCVPLQAEAPGERLVLETDVQMVSGEELEIRLGVRNDGPEVFEGDKAFDGQMTLDYASGEPRAAAHILALQPLQAGETAWILTWHGQLDPGTYVLTWEAEHYGSRSAAFALVAGERGMTVQPHHARSPLQSEPVPEVGQVTVQRVQVDGQRVLIAGSSGLPDGTCILSELRADGVLQAWWPTDRCATVQGGKWNLAVALVRAGAPESLRKDTMYEVRAWSRESPSTSVVFPFDLAGPPSAK